MSLFSDKLRKYITDSGYTVYRLSKLSGVERTGLQRVLSGQRLLSEQSLDCILDFLQINFTEREELYRLYRIEELGEAKYRQQELLLLFMKKLAASPSSGMEALEVKKELRLAEHKEKPYYIYQGTTQIVSAIQAAMEYIQSTRTAPLFCMFLPPDIGFLGRVIPPPQYTRGEFTDY